MLDWTGESPASTQAAPLFLCQKSAITACLSTPNIPWPRLGEGPGVVASMSVSAMIPAAMLFPSAVQCRPSTVVDAVATVGDVAEHRVCADVREVVGEVGVVRGCIRSAWSCPRTTCRPISRYWSTRRPATPPPCAPNSTLPCSPSWLLASPGRYAAPTRQARRVRVESAASGLLVWPRRRTSAASSDLRLRSSDARTGDLSGEQASPCGSQLRQGCYRQRPARSGVSKGSAAPTT